MPVPSPSIALDKFTTFGDLLKFLRRRAGLTQLELSIAVGYSDTQISRLEQNRRLPDLATIAAQFVPALHLENEPEVTARLLELAAFPEASAQPNTPPRPRHPVAPCPPPKAAGVSRTSGASGNLPAQLTRFIGREQQIEEVKQLLSASRLVTLTGIGGCGKTRLALQVATHWPDEFRTRKSITPQFRLQVAETG
jgi:DNA-binding XRE family transcriptional regulator